MNYELFVLLKMKTTYRENMVERRATKLLAFLELEVESLNRRNQLGLAENYRYSGNSFRDYLSTLHRQDVPLSRVSAELLIAYQQWLWDRGIQRNTSAF